MSQIFTNNGLSLLEVSIHPSDLSIQVIPGDGYLFPQPIKVGDFFLVTLEDNTASTREIIKIIGRTGDILHIDPLGRGFENTLAQTWSVDTLVDHRLTAFTLNKIDQNIVSVTTDPVNPQQIPSLSSRNVDVFPTSPYNQSCKWMVTVFDSSGRISVAELLAVFRGSVLDPSFTVFAKTGDSLKYHFEVISSGNNMTLQVINDDSISLTYAILRINYQ